MLCRANSHSNPMHCNELLSTLQISLHASFTYCRLIIKYIYNCILQKNSIVFFFLLCCQMHNSTQLCFSDSCISVILMNLNEIKSCLKIPVFTRVNYAFAQVYRCLSPILCDVVFFGSDFLVTFYFFLTFVPTNFVH